MFAPTFEFEIILLHWELSLLKNSAHTQMHRACRSQFYWHKIFTVRVGINASTSTLMAMPSTYYTSWYEMGIVQWLPESRFVNQTCPTAQSCLIDGIRAGTKCQDVKSPAYCTKLMQVAHSSTIAYLFIHFASMVSKNQRLSLNRAKF